MRVRVGAIIALVAALWQCPAFAGDAATAREQLKVGYLLAQQGKCDEALPHLRESLRLDPKAITLINLADCEEKVGKLADAMGHWADARQRAVSEGHRPIEEEATARLSALEPRLARVTLVLSPSAPRDASVERDGIALGAPSLGIALPVDPGAHTIVVKAAGHAESTTQIAVGEGEVKRVELSAGAALVTQTPPAVAPAPTPRTGVSPLTWIGFGVAGAGLAAGAVTGLMAMNAGSQAKTACPDRVCDRASLDEIETGRTMSTVSTVSFIAAGVGVAVGIFGLVGTTKPTARTAAVSVSPTGIDLRGRF